MAKTLGQSAVYVRAEALRQQKQFFIAVFIAGALLAGIVGYSVRVPFEHKSFTVGSILTPVALIVMAVAIERVAVRKLCEFERCRNAMRRGIAGEMEVAVLLDGLPDTFFVINDLPTSFGNIDHVVIGPTGAFVIDAKNWRGLVTADGNKELLLNGKRPSKPAVKSLLRSVMSAHEKVRSLSGLAPFIQGVIAFTVAYVDAPFGTTGWAHCIPSDRLTDYIANRKTPKPIGPDHVARIAQAFVAIAAMDTHGRHQKPRGVAASESVLVRVV
jgi:hypothetical protein